MVTPLIVTPSTIKEIFGISRSTALMLEQTEFSFPKRVKLSPGKTGWFVSELEDYFSHRPRINDNDSVGPRYLSR